jgi:hypothetical protein
MVQIPKNEKHYGCFCSPRCAVGYLMNSQIDSSEKFESLALLQRVYGETKPAPNPHYTLRRFQGNMTIDEYRGRNEMILVLQEPTEQIQFTVAVDADDKTFGRKIKKRTPECLPSQR